MNLIQSFSHPTSETSCFIKVDNGQMIYERRFIEAKFTRPQHYAQMQEQFELCREKLKHPNIINFHKITKENGATVLTREYVNGENFNFYISLGNLPYESLMASAKTITEIVKFIHSKGIIIRSLIPSNIIVDINGSIHFVDIGYDSIFVDDFQQTKKNVHLLFSSPEAINNDHQPSFEKDIWCLGVTLYMIITGNYPWPIKNTIKLMQLLMKGEVDFPQGIEPELASLLRQMLSVDPKKRPTAAEVHKRLKRLTQFGQHQRITSEIILSNPDLPKIIAAAQNGIKAKQGVTPNQLKVKS
ncbi:CAMK family protein kinase [Tritrichomonas foetus]|uniref:CAMK family protein kinase n=1 Tax=Tritrichomonas foetus TaxID=1144522 RepID=A0A1J4J4D7_9EUKA|nr:CAMK family protein kinase [Tritrichomonas foetus]|eukprot:OHS93007.1 CAMK family protein kinase [Tritrichomonas foetus]